VNGYMSLPEYHAHLGCLHPVHDHGRAGCKTWGCSCSATYRELAGPSGLRQVADITLRFIGAAWLVWHILGYLIGWLV
jgi:hypothetical protein